jgi:hypothetical protein
MFTTFLWTLLLIYAAGCTIMQLWLRQRSQASASPPDFKTFQTNYLLVYMLVMCSYPKSQLFFFFGDLKNSITLCLILIKQCRCGLVAGSLRVRFVRILRI